jgi:hypothetical protein
VLASPGRSARILRRGEVGGLAQVPAAQAALGFSFSPGKAFERRPVLPLTTTRSGSLTPLETPCTGLVNMASSSLLVQ